MTNNLTLEYKSAIRSINNNYNKIRKDKKLSAIAGVDWLLDNFYIISQTHAILKKDMSDKLFNSMQNDPGGTPLLFNDIYNIVISEKEITTEVLISRLKNIKRDLKNKEIHAIPLFINISIIIRISKVLNDINDTNFEKNMGELFIKLRQNDTYRIKEIFSEISKSEKLLLTDEVYKNMDYKSKSYYRFIIDKLSKKYKMPEIEVIKTALELSKKENNTPKNHIGYYLIEKPLGKDKTTPEKSLYRLSVLFFSMVIIFITNLFIRNIFLIIPQIIVSFEIGINITNYFFSKYIKPKKLVGLSYKTKIPDNSKTLVTIAVLINEPKNAVEAFDKLETYYLGNHDENIYFSILADSKDSDTQVHKDDQSIIEELGNQVTRLNKKYNVNSFTAFYRVRKYSQQQKKFMGWERKRGGLQHLVEFLRNDKNSCFKFIGGDLSKKNIKYIITLDSDTHLPISAAKKMISIADHPLNEFKYENGNITNGYGILQPRIATCLKSAVRSKFSKFFTGISGFDHYQENVSDIYQDVFSEATFTGKGLLNVDAFYYVIRKYIPENQVLSHDLLEGSIVKTGLVSDIEFSDGFPSKVVSYYSRMHRWIRGDWQLLPYLNKKITDSEDNIINNPLNRLSKWKIIDNLRRSTVPIVLIIFSFFCSHWIYPLIILLGISFPIISNVFDKVFYGDYKYMADRSRVKLMCGLKAGLIQGFLLFAFLPYNAWVAVDAIIRALYRQYFSKKNILEWTTAEESDKKVKNSALSYFIKMKANIIFGIALLLFKNFIFGGIFIIAPYIAKIISEDCKSSLKISGAEKIYLRENAYNIWCFFEKFVTKKDNFLPPDNYQKNPFGGIAHRTSPTNIGLYLVSVMTARDLGFITTPKMVEKLEETINTINQMPKFNGHLYNWYNTLNLEILKPEFISTVDSGNFVACLISLREGLCEYLNRDMADEKTVEAIIDMSENIKLDFSPYLNNPRKKDIINLCDKILGENSKNSLVDICEHIKSSLMNFQREDIEKRVNMLISDITKLIDETDFAFLYNEQKELFSIGANNGVLVNSYYDLIASEARQASYIAIARGEVPKKHWNSMSKNMTKQNRYKGLVSWTGTSFEYLMPLIFMPNYELSLWDETYKFVVNGQISYAKKHGLPFGISESGFYSFDNDLNYQYQAFGTPAHGLKRGLENDLVISPYSTFLSLMVSLRKSISNLKRLEKMGMNSKYGFFEAVDFTKSRAKNKRGYNIVESYMSHHQGMSLLSINNCINNKILSDRFMRNKQMQSCEELLLEKVPVNVKIVKQNREKTQVMRPIDRIDLSFSKKISDFNSFPPECIQISDGISSLFLTDRGQNYIKYGKINITRFRNDFFSPYNGSIFYIYDVEENYLFTPTVLPFGSAKFNYRTKFSDSSAVYTCENDDLSVTLTANLIFGKNTVMWTLNLKNKRNINKKYKIYCYNEIILSDIKNDIAHRAFNNMFLRIKECNNGLIFAKTKREDKDQPYFYSLYVPEGEVKARLQKFVNRFDLLKNNSFIPLPDISKQEKGIYSNTEPVAAILTEREVKRKTGLQLHFFQSFSKDEEEMLQTKEEISQNIDKLDGILKTSSENYKISSVEKALFFEVLSFLVFGNFGKNSDIIKKYPDETAIWQVGVSGDYPILTVKLEKDFEQEFINTLTKMYTFLSSKNLRFDLIILTNDDDTYQTPVYKSIKKAVSKVNEGIFVFSVLTLDKEILELLCQRADFFLSAGSMKDFISTIKKKKVISDKIRLTNTEKQINSSYSCYYSGNDFIIELPDGANLNTVYSNVVANKKLGFISTQNGGGYTYFKNSREFKITNWVNDPASDVPTEILYCLDKKDRQAFSLTPYPKQSGDYKIIYSRGSVLYQHFGEIETQLKMFTAFEAPVKFYNITLKNNTSQVKSLKIYYYTRPVLDVSPKLKYNLSKEKNVVTVESIFSKKHFSDAKIKITATQDIASYTFSNLEFIGGGNLTNPDAFNKETFSEQSGQFSNACVLLTFDIEIEPNEAVEFAVSMSVDEQWTKGIDELKQEEHKTLDFYNNFASHFQINTPDTDLNNMVNTFLPYQIYVCRLIARTSYYQCGGAFGFRDQLQDGIGLLHYNPDILKNQIINAAKRQFMEGDVLHWWHVFDNETEINGIRTRFRDDNLWLIYSTCEYIKITNDYSILDIELPYITGDVLKPGENEKYTTFLTCDKLEPLFSHLQRAMKYAVSLSEKGLAHFGGGDWNDGMNRVGEKGKGSSVWLSWFLYENLNRLKKLADYKRVDNDYAIVAKNLKDSVNKNAWDGEWYIRGIYDNGQKLGSRESDECKIDLIAQAWSKISNGGEQDKVNQALASAYEKLFDKNAGILKLLSPAFADTKNEPGYIKSYIPGIRENGGQYTHAAIWGAMAFLLNNDCDRGYEIIKAINPAKFVNNKKDLERYKVEPFVIAADVYSAENMEGRGGWSWYTGAAGWYYKVIMENLMGIHIENDILTIKPALPGNFTTLSLTYKIRGKTFNVVYKKTGKYSFFANSVEADEIKISSAPDTNDIEVHF